MAITENQGEKDPERGTRMTRFCELHSMETLHVFEGEEWRCLLSGHDTKLTISDIAGVVSCRHLEDPLPSASLRRPV